MGHFIIDLPDKRKGDVRWGEVRKMQFSLFRKNKSESRKGYIVNVSDSNGKTEYRLFKSPNGEWSEDPDGKMELNDQMLFLIKNAIVEKESDLQ